MGGVERGAVGIVIDGEKQEKPTYPHADCAVCIFWKDGCKEKHDPKELGPYQKCWWCRTEDRPPKAGAKPAQTARLF
jgi:hypothetical protein